MTCVECGRAVDSNDGFLQPEGFVCGTCWYKRLGDPLYVQKMERQLEGLISGVSISGAGDTRSAIEQAIPPPRTARDRRAVDSLRALAVADALGAHWEGSNLDPGRVNNAMESSNTIAPWTDDTQMALSIVEILERFGAIDQEELAKGFALRYEEWRGYGPGMRVVLTGLRQGIAWRDMRERVFRNGSFGNGSAMRAAPIGAYYYDASSDVVLSAAARSAEITHSHPEGVAGAAATALASWLATRSRDEQPRIGAELLTIIANRTSAELDVASGLWRAVQLQQDTPLDAAVNALGNGSKVTCQDTVPLALWIALNHLDNYEKAIRLAIAAGGDTDTIAAISGGIIGARLGVHGIPKKWLSLTEAIPFTSG